MKNAVQKTERPTPAASRASRREALPVYAYLLLAAATLGTLLLCVCVGSVSVPAREALLILRTALQNALAGAGTSATDVASTAGVAESAASIILSVRLPRVLCVALVGASLSLCGAVMQSLLKNPLADGSTLGVSSGASLGAVLAIAFGISFPRLPFAGTMVMAILFAFLSLLLILSLAWRMDHSLSTHTIILIGIIYSMFVTSITSLVVAFASDRLHSITFWTMGSLGGSSLRNAAVLAVALLLCGTIVLFHAKELNAFAIGEENARHIGVPVQRVRLLLLVMVSILIGVCVSIGGSIAFVGLVSPHILRMLTGPNHKRLLPAVLFGGAIFLLLTDLVARTILRPSELPIGVVTSFLGAIVFVFIFYRSRKGHT